MTSVSLTSGANPAVAAGESDAASGGAHRHLAFLRDNGYVRADEVDNRGTIHWHLVPERAERAARAWLAYVSGAERSSSSPPGVDRAAWTHRAGNSGAAGLPPDQV